MDDELDSIEAHLVRNVYLGRESLLEAAKAESDIFKRMQHAFQKNNLNYVVQELAYGGQIRAAKRETSLVDIIRFGIDARWINLGVGPSSSMDVGRQKKRAYGWAIRHNTWFNLSLEQDARSEYLVYQAHVDPHDMIAGLAAISYALRFINGIMPSETDEMNMAVIQRFVAGGALEALLTSTLSFAFSREVRWEWKESLNGFRVVWLHSTNNLAFIERLRQDPNLSRSRRNELDSTIFSVAGLRLEPAIVSVANLLAYRVGEFSPYAEFDGVALTRDSMRNELVLTLVEAKRRTKSAYGEAKHDLREKLKKLDPKQGITVGRIRTSGDGRNARAWCHIRMRYARHEPEDEIVDR